MSDVLLRDRRASGVEVLQLHRPEALNALDAELVTSLGIALADLARNEDCPAIVLTGAGRGFCAGLDRKDVDLAEVAGSPAAAMAVQRRYGGLVQAVHDLPMPVIAAVNGPAYGAGLAIAMAADVRLADPTATFTAGFIHLGIAGTELGLGWLLQRELGYEATIRFAATGETCDADTAAARGLCSSVTAPGAVLDDAVALAEAMAAHGRLTLAATKRNLRAQREIGSLTAAATLDDHTQAWLVQRHRP